MRWLFKVICLFVGHVSERHISEDDELIYRKRCRRCHAKLGMPRWKIHAAPPCYCSPQEWAMFCEEKDQNFRNGL